MSKNIFDIIKNLRSSSEYIWDDECEAVYSPYIINKGMSFSARTIMYANDMNLLYNLTPKQQYDFYHYFSPKSREFIKWIKSPQSNETEQMVSAYFGYNRQKTREIMPLLSDNDIERIKKLAEQAQSR